MRESPISSDAVISSSLEDYLEAIAEIIEKNDHAHTKDIALKLGVTMPSVTNALQMLSARGLIDYQPHTPVLLTSSGAERAAVIRRRHQALRAFFSGLLKVDDADADAAACRIEHVISEVLLSRLVVFAEAVRDREDCAGLREFLKTAMPAINPDSDAELISLDRLPVGRRGIISHVAENLRGVKKFADLGLVPGTCLEFEGRAPFGDLLRIRVLGSSLSLRRRDAMHIWVRLAE